MLAAYGDDIFYHYGAVFAALRILGWCRRNEVNPEIWIYTDKPDLFSGYPVYVIHLTPENISDWSLRGRYHFRIKNRVLVDALTRGCSSLLFLDSDMVVTGRTDRDFHMLSTGVAIMHGSEGRAQKTNAAYRGLRDLRLSMGSTCLQLTGEEPMWRSSVIGVSSAMVEALNHADEIMCQLVGQIDAHTIEQFVLGVALSRATRVHASKTRFIDYSDYFNKAIARERLSLFFKSFGDSSVEAQIAAARRLQPTSVIERFKLKRGLIRRKPQDYKFVPQ